MKTIFISFLKPTKNIQLDILVGGCLCLYFVIRLTYSILGYLFGDVWNYFEYTEFLINFQGGFVRRGLFGEILYHIYVMMGGYPMFGVLTFISFSAFAFVMVYFFRQFLKNGYCWWLLLCPLCVGCCEYIVRKDYILYSLLIWILYVLRGTSLDAMRRIGACMIMLLCLMLHEASIFFCFPIFALLLLSDKQQRLLNYILVLLPLLLFGMLSYFKGNQEIATTIVDSWNAVMPETPLRHESLTSIGALGWDTKSTFIKHWHYNVGVTGDGIVLIPVIMMATYYLFSNFLAFFSFSDKEAATRSRLCISLLYTMSLLCMLPMFTILSCDKLRLFQYAAVATFSVYLILSPERIIALMPGKFVRIIRNFNNRLTRFLPPSKGLLIILLLILGVSPCEFTLDTCWSQSVLGTLSNVAITYTGRLLEAVHILG